MVQMEVIYRLLVILWIVSTNILKHSHSFYINFYISDISVSNRLKTVVFFPLTFLLEKRLLIINECSDIQKHGLHSGGRREKKKSC